MGYPIHKIILPKQYVFLWVYVRLWNDKIHKSHDNVFLCVYIWLYYDSYVCEIWLWNTKTHFQIVDAKLPLTFLDPLYEDETKLTAVATSVFSMNNVENPGYPVRFITEIRRQLQVQQILDILNKENWLLNVDVSKLKGWKKLDTYENLHEKFNFPKIKSSTFHQLYELNTSIQSKKGISIASHHRRFEVDDLEKECIETFQEYCTSLRSNLEDLCVKVKKFDSPTNGYLKSKKRPTTTMAR